MSKRWPLASAVSFLMACSTPAPPIGSCGGEVCGQTQRCEPSTLHCVEDLAPKLTLLAPTTVVSDASFVVSGVVTDDTDDTTLSWRDGVGEWQDLEFDSKGAFSFTVSARMLDAEPMHLTVRASDGVTKLERSVLVIVDRVGPRFELKSPAAGMVTGGSEVVIRVVARDGSEGLQELKIDEQGVTNPRTGTEHSATLSIPPGDRRVLPVTVSAKDVNGNRAMETLMVLVDGQAPTLRFLSPGSQPNITSPQFHVEVQATDLSEVRQVRIAMEDGGFIDSTRDGGAWSTEFTIPPVEQTVTFTAQATDGAGNTASFAVTAQIDRVAPAVEVTGPAADSLHKQSFDVSVLAGADATSVNASFAGVTVPLTRGTANTWQGQMPMSLSRDSSAELLTAVVTDAAGNQRTSAARQLFIDTVAPVIAFTAPAANAKLNLSNFTGSNDVTIAWQVQDGDGSAATVSVDGVPSTTPNVRVTTSPSDNGRVFSRTVVAADRAGNTASASLTFTVDRVAPTITTWLPAANARNVEPRTTTITFSERVNGATSSTDALSLSTVTQPGSWNAAHTTWTSVDLAPYAVFTATLGNLTDDAGNPVAASSRKFHTAAVVPASGLVLQQNVTSFHVTGDTDGVITIGTISSSGYRVFGLSPTTGAITAPVLTSPNEGEFTLNASLSVNPTTLIATHRVGSARVGGVNAGPFPVLGLSRHVITDGVAVAVGSTADATGAVVSQAAYVGETDTTAHALIDGSTLTRGAATRTLGTSPHLTVAQSRNTWAAFSLQPSGVSWTRFLCFSVFGGSTLCEAHTFNFNQTALTNPTQLSAAVTPSGRCMAVMVNSASVRMGAFLPLLYCNETRPLGSPPHSSCQNTSYTASSQLAFWVAPFGGNGEDNLLGAYAVSGVPRLQKMSDAVNCTGFNTDIGAPAPEAARAFEPVQLGNKAALLYTDLNNTLKLYVP
jgi:hypothetical protein